MATLMRSKLAILVAVVSLASCGATPEISSYEISQNSLPQAGDPAKSANILTDVQNERVAMESDASSSAAPPTDTTVTEQQPQLIKQAQLNLVVTSVDESLKKASQLIRTHQGDILDLQDNHIEDIQRTAYLRIREARDLEELE